MLLMLLCLLGSDDFQTREAASSVLESYMDYGVYVQLRTFTCPDPETVHRTQNVVLAYEGKLRVQFALNMRGYRAWPQIDEGIPWERKGNERWSELQHHEIVSLYLHHKENGIRGSHPHFMNYRYATQLWMQERIGDAFTYATQATTQQEFQRRRKWQMKQIQKDLDMLIKGDKWYYQRSEIPNPFEEGGIA